MSVRVVGGAGGRPFQLASGKDDVVDAVAAKLDHEDRAEKGAGVRPSSQTGGHSMFGGHGRGGVSLSDWLAGVESYIRTTQPQRSGDPSPPFREG